MSDSENDPLDARPPPNITSSADPENTIKILLATDNHIGYLERDPIRGQDSINTFKEILQLAVKNDVDFVLLAGDLFHENKPSRDCLYQTLALLREYTLGDKPIQVELLSDPDEGKPDGYSFPAINYEDPNFNISIPVFSIHGNHDDPQGPGVNGALCALDVLSVSGLLNYMGKFDLPISDADASTTGIAVRPVLLRKGTTRLGMYGVGNVKDARMHFELRSNRVRMYMPRDKEDWFNILLVHQNRVKHGPQEYVPEGMFDDSVDLVVWGHEHDCRIIPESVAGKNYYVTQPGSSVATSLADGEALEKHVALLEIKDKEFKLTPIPLRTVRPFVIDEVVLEDVAEEEGLDVNDQMEISKYLKLKVNELIEQAHQVFEERNARAVESGDAPLAPMLPLIRLKVDTTNVTQTSNPIRFGQEFHGRVANPRDLLVFHRSKKSASRKGKGKGKGTGDAAEDGEVELSIDDPELTTHEKLAKVRVGTLVKEFLAAQELQLLGENGMSDAIRLFVEKDDLHAIQTHVARSLKQTISNVKSHKKKKVDSDVDSDDLDELVAKAKQQQEQDYLENGKNGKSGAAKGKGKARAAAPDEDQDQENAEEDERNQQSDDSMKMDVDTYGRNEFDMSEEEEEVVRPVARRAGTRGAAAASSSKKAAPARKAPAKKAATATTGRGRKKVVEPSSDEDEVVEIDEDEDDEIEEVKPVKRTNRAAILSQRQAPPPKKAPATKRKAAASSKGGTQTQLTFAPAGRSARAAAAASRAKSRAVVDDDDDDD